MSSSPEPIQARTSSSQSRTVIHSRILNQMKQPIAVIEISDSESDHEEGLKRQPAAQPAAGPSRTRARSPAKGKSQANPLQQRTSSNDNMTLPMANKPVTQLFLPSDEENKPPCRNADAPLAPDVATRIAINTDTENSRSVDVASIPPEALALNIQLVDQQQDDPTSIYLAQVMEIVPDVQPDHAIALITQFISEHQHNVVEVVLHNLFDNPGYPKLDKKGKRKATETETANDNNKKSRIEVLDYRSTDRDYEGGEHYPTLAIDQLMLDFPEIPKAHIRKTFVSKKSLYVPTYFFLVDEKKSGVRLPYVPKKRIIRHAVAKGKGIALADPAFEAEREWLLQNLFEDEAGNDAVLAERLNEQDYEGNGDGIECGCCFSTYAFNKMVQCEDGHLFCTECMTSYAENLLGSHNVNIVCMDQSGCKLPFPVSELRRFLPSKLMDMYERVKQTKEIEMAGLEGLEECPCCEYKCVIENPEEKLFRCGNLDTCGAITCRQCKKPDHLPKSCKEMEEDRHLDGRHAIEEAMTRALMRTCPKCNRAFVKDDGCNKMTCPNCHSLLCYVCRKLIPEGYAHFNQAHPRDPTTSKNSKCPLWDGPVEARHAKEVQEAAEKAKEEYMRENPDVDDEDIHVDISKTQFPVPGPPLPQMQMPRLPDFQMLHHQALPDHNLFDFAAHLRAPPIQPVMPVQLPVVPPPRRAARPRRRNRR